MIRTWMARPPLPNAFRDLERALLRRRFSQLDSVLRLEIAAIGTLVAAFCGWQLRIPLDGIARTAGPAAAARALALVLAALVLAGGAGAGTRYAHRLRSPGSSTGLAWLALPVPPQVLARHLAWDARLAVGWALVPALGTLVAALGLVPAPLLALIAVTFVVLLVAAGHAGCAAAVHLATRDPAGSEGPAGSRLHPIERALTTAPPETRASRLPAARWRRSAPWRALWLKDLMLALRPTPAQGRARSTLVIMVLSALMWRLPVDPPLALLAAFALALVAAATLAAWLVELAGADPYPALRVLPLGVGPVWASRVAWAAMGALLLAALHALAFPALAPPALRLFLASIAAATLTIGVLGAQLGITLHPRADHARRVLGMTLLVAVAASVMMPLLGWALLLAAVIHSAFRMPGWSAGGEA